MKQALDILRADLVRTMKLLGTASVAGLGAEQIVYPATWRASGSS